MSEQRSNRQTLLEMKNHKDISVNGTYLSTLEADSDSATKLETINKLHEELNEALMDVYKRVQTDMAIIKSLIE